ncbi:MAG: ATP-binding cassette domain-containing protein [Umezawaea sp.]
MRGLDLDVEKGELVAFLGPNGAGKSTSLRMLTTLLAPTSGEARIAGHDVRTDAAAVRRRIGYVGQGNGAGPYFRVRDELVTQGRCHGFGAAESRRRADDLLATMELEDLANRAAGTLSGGQRRRLDIALGLVHGPDLLFLDEPSSGLDPQNRANLWEHILRLRDQLGTTVFLTTHYLEEADTKAERVVVIDHGRIIADDTAERLKAGLEGDHVTITTDNPVRTARIADRIPLARNVITDQDAVRLRVPDGAAVLPVLLRALDDATVDVRAAEVRRPTLDDVFLSLTGRSLREQGGAAA